MRLRIIIPFLISILIFGLIGCTTLKTETPEAIIDSTNQIEGPKTTNTKTDDSGNKYGLTEFQRQQAFYDLIKLQDSISSSDPNRNEKMEEAYSIVANEYGITKDEMSKIGIEGIEKDWPMP